jgi:hypothetical protein
VVVEFFNRMERNGVTMPDLFPRWPDHVGRLLAAMLGGLAGIALYAVGQIVLPEVYTRMTERWLREGVGQPPERVAFESRTEKPPSRETAAVEQ